MEEKIHVKTGPLRGESRTSSGKTCIANYTLLQCNTEDNNGWPGRLGNHIVAYFSAALFAAENNSTLLLDDVCENELLNISGFTRQKAKMCSDNPPQQVISTHNGFWLYMQRNNSLLGIPGTGPDHFKLQFPSFASGLYKEILHPLFSYINDRHLSLQLSQTVVIHVRSGDAVNPEMSTGNESYMPPPFSFYLQAIESFPSTFDLIVVTEPDHISPVVDQLKSKYRSRLRIQATSLLEDVTTLLNAPYLVLSQGTFGYSLSLASQALKCVYMFDNVVLDLDPLWEVQFVIYEATEYVQAMWPWLRTESQIETMLTYPQASLRIKDTRRLEFAANDKFLL